jgi:formylglycine-generating enzyme required for sulfatase activity
MVRVEGGTFLMGSTNGDDDEKPVRQVTIRKAFYMSDHEVTQQEWADVMGTTIQQQLRMVGGSLRGGIGYDYPMYYVSWYEAIEYCNKRSIKEGLTPAYSGSGDAVTCDFNATGYRLPTEAEWEYAAKGGNKDSRTYNYSGGNSVGSVAWYSGNSQNAAHIVKMKKANSLGLYDMSGNVREWCWDRYGSYGSGSRTDPSGAAAGSSRVIRGGSWYGNTSSLRSAYRNYDAPSNRSPSLGFRLVRP